MEWRWGYEIPASTTSQLIIQEIGFQGQGISKQSQYGKNMGFLLFGVSRNNWRKHTGMGQSECYGRDCALKSKDRAAIFQSNLLKGLELELEGKRR